jgi:glycyl-tRNA synthetase beta chain
MGELLLELLSEEIPARMQRRAIADLVALVRDKLAAAEIPAASIAGYVTPRRLAVIADGIPRTQPDRTEERRGPRVGAPEAAIGGFLRAAGLNSLDQCEVRSTDRGEFHFAVLRQKGGDTAEILPDLLLAAIRELPWPKSMRFPAMDLRWVRPLNSAICLFDGTVVPLALGRVPVGRATRGHRFLAPDEIEVADAADYRAKLEKAHVVLDQDRRRQIIADGLAERAAADGLRVKPDEGLLDEVTGLVEFPVVLAGSIDADFVRPLPEGLPPEVLATAMRTHQKYFSCLYPEPTPAKAGGTPAPRFLFVANNITADGGAAIVAGNERVLRARLSDARFFWDQDRKVRLEDRVEALKQRVYHEKLGSVYDKVERTKKTAFQFATFLQLHQKLEMDNPMRAAQLAERAAELAKTDLSTGMVGEFPELQGVMGRYYALADGEDARVADAIGDHYKPLGPNDSCPTAPLSVIVALADKVDTLAAFFAIGEVPKGSRDPFALRRAALGVIRLIRENRLRLPLGQAIDFASNALRQTNYGLRDIKPELVSFFEDRIKVYLREQGVRHDLIAAAFGNSKEAVIMSYLGIGGLEDDLVRLLARVAALQAFLDTDDGVNLLTVYRRAANIVAVEERRDGKAYTDAARATLLAQAEEKALGASLDEIGGRVAGLVEREEFAVAMAALAELRRPVDAFFEKVTVNADDPGLRANRLRLLSRIRSTMNQVADFSQIEG